MFRRRCAARPVSLAQPALLDANGPRIAGQPMKTQNRAQARNPLNPIDARSGSGRRFERFWSREDRLRRPVST
jgi:hypothetical protein